MGSSSPEDWGEAGAIYADPVSSTCDIVSSSFVNCKATSESGSVCGGAIYVFKKSSTLNIRHSTFDGCMGTDTLCGEAEGGAVYVDDTSNCNLLNTSFLDCSVVNSGTGESLGGAIMVENDCSVTLCTFIDCSAVNTGTGANIGGAVLVKGTCSVTKCTFKNCVADSGNYAGAAIQAGANGNGFECVPIDSGSYWCDVPTPHTKQYICGLRAIWFHERFHPVVELDGESTHGCLFSLSFHCSFWSFS